MHIVVTGGGGFIGQRLAARLCLSELDFDRLVLVDKVLPAMPVNDPRISCVEADLTVPGAADRIVNKSTGIMFHLAAVVSSQAENDFDLGWTVNMDITRRLLEACRAANSSTRFVFTSSLAVFGGNLPEIVSDQTAVTPRSSYGAQKAVGEILVNDYSRKGFVDGVVLRLPTICVRPGRPNQAASSFVSSIIREPLNGEDAWCPVQPDMGLWLCSPATIIENLLIGARLESSRIPSWRILNMPGISVTVREMLTSLRSHAGDGALAHVRFREDPAIERIVGTWPSRIDNSLSLGLGFKVDTSFDDFIAQHRRSG